MRYLLALLICATIAVPCFAALSGPDLTERQFTQLPMEARRLTGPLFWLHGDARETKDRLDLFIRKVAEGGNGSFTTESRPHEDWLGPRWFKDLSICLDAAKKNGLQMWIFDEKWWPSGMVGGKVPIEYGAKRLVAESVAVEGPSSFAADGYGGTRFVAVVAGKSIGDGIDPDSLIDLGPSVTGGKLAWNAPPGQWQVMKFTWDNDKRKPVLVDGASQDCVDWFLKTVYEPHYDRFKADFGKTIQGFFYDEPETPGDWGTLMSGVFAERGQDWKKALVAWKFKLAGEQQAAARYAYIDALGEAWGRGMFGGMTKWCETRGVKSIGHFLEHSRTYLSPDLCAYNMDNLLKHSSMGAFDNVFRQIRPGERNMGMFQMPKQASSITHVYGKADDITMCEIFGASGQALSYPEMKWVLDQHEIRGVNFMIPHSINPRAPYDSDCPPYFYMGQYEPRWPLYRVWSEYADRLGLMLTGGRHVCPVAMVFCGNSAHVGRAITPEVFTTALDDAQFDSDWVPYEVLESSRVSNKRLCIQKEQYKVLVVPPVEVVPVAVLEKAKAFLDAGGIVVGYGFLPSKSATLGKTSGDVTALCRSIWGGASQPSLQACVTNPNGGRSYLLSEKPTPEDLRRVFTTDAGIHPDLEVLQGKTDNWLHVLHRVKDGRDVFLVCNQNYTGDARRFTLRATAEGVPECWDAMRNRITSVPFKRVSTSCVDIDLTLEASESALIVFRPKARALPSRMMTELKPVSTIRVTRDTSVRDPEVKMPSVVGTQGFAGCSWVWSDDGQKELEVPPGTRYFRGKLTVPPDARIKQAIFTISADNSYSVTVNGVQDPKLAGTEWQSPKSHDITKLLHPGENVIAITAANGGEGLNPAGLIGAIALQMENGKEFIYRVDKTWRVSSNMTQGWEQPGFDDSAWGRAKEVAAFGQGPWGGLGGQHLTLSPVKANTFAGRCVVPSGVNLRKSEVFLEMTGLRPEEAASVSINGSYAGGFIGRPFRLEVSKYLKSGANAIRITPFAPDSVRLVVYNR